MKDDWEEIRFHSFLQGGGGGKGGHGQGHPLFDVVRPAETLPTAGSSTLQGARKDGFGKAKQSTSL